MSQVGIRPPSQIITGRIGGQLPQIQHPLSRLSNPNNMDVRGTSRAGDRPNSNPTSGRPLPAETQYPPRKSLSAVGRENRLTSRHGVRESQAQVPVESIPEGVEVTYGDPNKTRLPIFGNRQDLSSRADNPSRNESRLSRASTQARLEIDELEMLLRQRVRGSFYEVRKKFRDNDPEGKGNVTREAMHRIVTTILNRQVTQSQFTRLMERIGFKDRAVVNYTEFFSCFRDLPQEDSYPTWMDPVQRHHLDKATMNSSQVHAQLKEKAKQRFLDIADLIPQLNPGGSGRILKPEFKQMLNKLMFYMDDDEFEKLWLKYDPDNIGTMDGEKFLNKLGITLRGDSRENGRLSPITESERKKLKMTKKEKEALDDSLEASSKRTPRRKEIERKQSLDVENWLKNKFREGFLQMREAFESKDTEVKGTVSYDVFLAVLAQFGLKLEKKFLAAFLSRCSVSARRDGTIPYREFLHRFQDRSEQGMTHNILTNKKHRLVRLFNDSRPDSEGGISTLSAIESQLMNMFQRDFLSLLGTFKSIDKLGTDVISQEEFRAAIESRFHLTLTDAQYDTFIDRIPLDEDGNVKYAEFMQQFDTKGMAPSLFDKEMAKPVRADEPTMPPIQEEVTPRFEGEPQQQKPDVLKLDESLDSATRRSSQELFKILKDLLGKRFTDVERAFHDLDEINSMRISQELMYQLLRRFPEIKPEVTRGEIRELWKTFITNVDKTLDYREFIRHFGFSKRSAAFPNAKISPPKRGDADFMIRSRKLNCATDMLQDNLRSKHDRLYMAASINGGGRTQENPWKEPPTHKKLLASFLAYPHWLNLRLEPTQTKIDYMWEDLRKEFIELDPYGTGFVSREEFHDILTELCVHLSDYELNMLTDKFDIKGDGRVSYIEFLKPFALRKQTWRHGNNMLSLLQHPQPELPIPDIVEPPQKGLHGITAKLRQKLSGDWKNLRRAFRKLDTNNEGYLSVPEFRSVLRLANVVLDEDEVYHVLNSFDNEMTGKIPYERFIDETFKPQTRHSVRKI